MQSSLKCLMLFLLLALPNFAQAEIHTFQYFSLDIPEGFTTKNDRDTIEIFDTSKENVLIISRLPYAAENIVTYTENLAKQWQATSLVQVDDHTHSFTVQDAEFGECKAYTKQIGNNQFFFLIAGENKEELDAIFINLIVAE